MLLERSNINMACASLSNTPGYIVPGMTGNCQLSVMSLANHMLRRKSDDQIVQIFKESYQIHNRSLILIDIRTGTVLEKQIERIAGEAIILNSPYRSSNGSSMCIKIIRIPWIGRKKKEII